MERIQLPIELFRRHALLVAIILIGAFAWVVYAPGLSGGFVFDDVANITSNDLVAMQALDLDELKRAALSNDNRPISRISFGLNHLVNGLDPRGYKLINLIIHIFNGILVFVLMSRLAHAVEKNRAKSDFRYPVELFALLAALAWTLHPVNLTNVLYVVQRMNSLSAMFVLVGMITYVRGREKLDLDPVSGSALMLAAALVLTPLAYYSKENGLLLPGFLFLVELCIFQFRYKSTSSRRILIGYFILVLAIPIIVSIGYILSHPGRFHEGYSSRYFTLGERLLTETRVIWIYVKMILVPDVNDFGLYWNTIPLSTGVLSPVTTLFSIIGLAGAAMIALLSRKAFPILSFGILLFLAGHTMESSFIPLEIMFEHRNYIPSIGLVMIVFYYLLRPSERLVTMTIKVYVSLAIITSLGVMTYVRARDWSNTIQMTLTEVENHPDSPRANYEMGKIYGQAIERGTDRLDEYYALARAHFVHATNLRENFTTGLFGLLLLSLDAGREIDQQWLETLADRLEHTAFEPENLMWLRSLSHCARSGRCDPDAIQLDRLFKAAFNNPSLQGRARSFLYSTYSQYKLYGKDDLAEALYYSRLTIKTDPASVPYRIYHAKLLILAGNTEEAEETIREIKTLDRNRLYSDSIGDLQLSIDKTKKN